MQTKIALWRPCGAFLRDSITDKPAMTESAKPANERQSGEAGAASLSEPSGDEPKGPATPEHGGQGDARRALVGKGSVYTMATALQLVGAIVVLPVLSRLLSADEFGRVALALVVANLLGLVATVGLPAVITRDYFTKDGSRKVRMLAAMALLCAVGVVALAFVTGPLWGSLVGGFDAALALGVATGAGGAMILIAQAILRAGGQARRFVMLSVISVVCGQLAGLGAVSLLDRSAAAYQAGVCVATLAAGLIGLLWTKPSFVGWRKFATPRGWFAIALPTLPHTAALFLMAFGDRFVVAAQLGDDDVAAYSLAYQTGALGITIIAAANNAWAPLIYGAGDERRWSVLAVTTKDMVRLAALLSAGLAFTAPLALAILADPAKYDIAELVPVVALTAFAAVPYTLYLASAHVLFWTGKTTQLLWIAPVAVLLNLAAKAVVLPHFGFVGAALVTIGAYALLALLVGWVRSALASVLWSGRAAAVGGGVAACLLGVFIPLNLGGHLTRAALSVAVLALFLATIRHLWREKRQAV